MKAVLPYNIELPWSSSPRVERRFRIIVAVCLIVALIMSLAFPFINVPETDRFEVEKIPPRLAKMLLEKKKVEPPKVEPPKPPEPEKPKVEKKKPEPKPKAAKPKPAPKPETKPKPKPKRTVEQIRKKVSNAGVLAMKDMLADLREEQPVKALTKKTKPLQTGGSKERTMARSVLVAKATKGSGGIDTSHFSRNSSDTELAGRETTTVTSDIEQMEVAAAPPPDEAHGRSEDEIKKTMMANYSAIDSIYQRALRKNPFLQGKVLFHIVIEPDGSVSACSIIESELGDKRLDHKLVLRIKRINFGAKDVETTSIDFPINFLPPS